MTILTVAGSLWLIGALGAILMVLGGTCHIYAERERVQRLRTASDLHHTLAAVLDDAAMATTMLGTFWCAIAAMTLVDPTFGTQPLLRGGTFSIAYVTASLFSGLGGALALFWWLRLLASFGRHRWRRHASYEEWARA